MISRHRARRLLGREREVAFIDELVAQPGGAGGSVAIFGEAGVGKTSLLEDAARRARDRGLRVLKTVGALSEAQLPYAALHLLLRPLLKGADALAPEQRSALLSAFGHSETQRPATVFLVGLATLELLTEAAGDDGALVIVDDGQWLDAASAEVLQFVARRVQSELVVLLFAIRAGWSAPMDFAQFESLRLGPLDDVSAAELLDTVASGLPQAVRQRLLDEAMGNPLALAELPHLLSPDLLNGTTQLPYRLPLSDRLERAFASRLSELGPVARRVLVTAASDEGATVAEVLQATSLVEGQNVSSAAIDAAVASRLIESTRDGTMRFRHPLMRSAIYQAAEPSLRRDAHRAFGEVLGKGSDRGAWHRAEAAVQPDEEVAAELESAAARARKIGAFAHAARALERAAALTPSPTTRARRLLETAELAIDLGQRGLATRLAREALSLDVGAADIARITWINESVSTGVLDAGRVEVLIQIAERAAAAQNTDLALKLLHLTAQKCWWSDPGYAARASVVEAAERLAQGEHGLRLMSLCSYALPMERAGAIMHALAAAAKSGPFDPDVALVMAQAAAQVTASDLAASLLEIAAAGLRHEGRLGQLARVTMQQAFAAVPLGDWSFAITAAGEARRLAAETGQPLWGVGGQLIQAIVAALKGELEIADTHAAEAEATAVGSGSNVMLTWVQVAKSFAAAARGDHSIAYEQMQRIFDDADPRRHWFIRSQFIGELADAAARSGRRAEAQAMLGELEGVAAKTPAPLVQISLRYARAVLAEDKDAESLFQQALATDVRQWPFYRARACLAYGAWLRRQRRVAESRAKLREARDGFDALGYEPWSARAREELRASGESSRRRRPEAWDQLSPQEMQIAQMAARGLSNREIGQNLFLSHKTVASHLYRLFPKLGITSRGQLSGALRDVRLDRRP